MRTRSFAVLGLAAASALALAGCSTASTDEASPSATVADLCDAAVDSGSASESVVVEGDAGTASVATFEAPLDIDALQATVVEEGSGEQVAAGDFVSYALTAYDGETGEELGEAGYEEGSLLPAQISPDNPIGQILGCATVGTRVVAAFPESDSASSEVYIFDLTGIVPTAAWGTEQDPVDGMPTVELDEDGAPTITVPDTDAPTDVELATLKEGDGPVVESGDTVLVQYTGVTWDDGEVFDSSWATGTPASFATTGVVDGFRQALEGYAVGSQVLVVIPPEYGYGEASEDNTSELAGETLVFVVDILGTQHVVSG